MKLTDVITLGDKIDIRLSQQIRQEHNGGDPAPVYQSSVCDDLSESEIEITMPSIGGRMVLLQVDAECEFVFFAKGGMYRCIGNVHKRYKKDGLYLLTVIMKTDPVKIQRREFFRVDYVTQMEYYSISEEIAQMKTMKEVLLAIENTQDAKEDAQKGQGNTQDISGGGTRFSSREPMERDSYLLLVFHLSNERMDESFELIGQVIATEPNPKVAGLYINRIAFLFKNLKDRERIVRFVFEEERRIRSKEVG
jgi:c-di-GMP-binding flagellar brake protein YcgR